MSYEVGQVLYTVVTNKQIIIPVRVVEQIVIKNLDGEETNYKVLLPNKKNQKIDMSKLENVFLDLDEVNSYLLNKTKSSIDKMIEDAITLEEDYFNSKKNNEENLTCKKEKSDIKINGKQIKISLEDGQVGNIIDNTNTLTPKIIEDIKEEVDINESTIT